LLYAAATGGLAQHPPLTWQDGAAVTVVYAAYGYPGPPTTGGMIGLPAPTNAVQALHCGTALDEAGELVARGGRVLAIVGQGTDLEAARQVAYGYLEQIDFPSGFYRRDIAAQAAAGQLPTPSLESGEA
jgi:phosphoribosylamine--glycine ligase